MAIICVHPSFNDLVGCRKGVPKSSLYKVCVGDDVLICDRKVADQYTTILNSLKVSISKSKSLISSTGCIEFAKRFLVNGLTLDLSPISTRCLSNFFHPYGYYAIRYRLLARDPYSSRGYRKVLYSGMACIHFLLLRTAGGVGKPVPNLLTYEALGTPDYEPVVTTYEALDFCTCHSLLWSAVLSVLETFAQKPVGSAKSTIIRSIYTWHSLHYCLGFPIQNYERSSLYAVEFDAVESVVTD
ncbi:hypothetical protein ZIOFF_074443 (mitochondrion) [Zingiber officinale]|uniref:Uncharacterized protein n=1 Tax=Zingiber officinale TaxID=94328 RepID=A0A8J5EST0_ZINOF|nr:hypothetical protein ZIOFF_075132 [Zingiber officinale]KAG6467705.1 hypothetical protein ZIOFF_074443 [Zingiber officinale]